MSVKFLAVEVACAHCRWGDEALLSEPRIYASLAEALEAERPRMRTPEWQESDAGGYISFSSSGGVEIIPLSGEAQ